MTLLGWPCSRTGRGCGASGTARVQGHAGECTGVAFRGTRLAFGGHRIGPTRRALGSFSRNGPSGAGRGRRVGLGGAGLPELAELGKGVVELAGEVGLVADDDGELVGGEEDAPAAEPGCEQHVDNRPIAERPAGGSDPELLGGPGPAATPKLVERSRRLHTLFKDLTCSSESVCGPRGGSPSSLIPLAGLPTANRCGAWAWTQVVKPGSEARWLLTVAGARF